MSSLPERYRNTSRIFISSMTQLPWGTWALLSLYLSLVSGVVVGLQYDYATAYYSVNSIDLLAPFGQFFRSLHFYSSQLFFLLTVVHLLAVYPKTEHYGRLEWYKLIGLIPIALLLLFTGYLLRADSTGTSAGAIAESITLAIPFAGDFVDSFFFGLEKGGLRRVYVHHVIGLDLVLLFLAWRHLRSYRVNPMLYPHFFGILVVFCALFAAPMEPDDPTASYISGPWFFLGLQELLRYFHPLLAGVFHPALFFILLAASHPANPKAALMRVMLWLWLSSYTALSVLAWLR